MRVDLGLFAAVFIPPQKKTSIFHTQARYSVAA
jgi:hypothetical protein